MGYKLINIHEVYHFQSRTKDLFKGYIDTFLKIKQEASGYPSNIVTEDDKIQYINDYENVETVKLDPCNIKMNPGRRAVAKLMLNSFWGEFGQNDDKMQTAFVSSVEELNIYFATQKLNVSICYFFLFPLQR